MLILQPSNITIQGKPHPQCVFLPFLLQLFRGSVGLSNMMAISFNTTVVLHLSNSGTEVISNRNHFISTARKEGHVKWSRCVPNDCLQWSRQATNAISQPGGSQAVCPRFSCFDGRVHNTARRVSYEYNTGQRMTLKTSSCVILFN